MLKLIKSAVLGLALVCGSASATVITLESRDIDNSFDKTSLITSWNTLATGTSQVISSFENISTGKNKANLLSFDFVMNYNGMWSLAAGLDAGLGAEVFLDGVLVAKRTDDLWWARNWSNSDVLSVPALAISQGKHTIELYWAERCCSGPGSILLTDYRTGSTNSLSAATIASASIPEPAGILLLSLGLIGLRFSRKSK